MIEPILDVSRWQDYIDKQKFLAAGALGIIIRAGSQDDSGPYMDYQFENNAQKFNGEIPCGYYWYFRPEYSASTQATYFANLMRSVRTDIFPMIDVESNFKKVSMGVYQNRLYEFMSIVEDLMGMESMIYTRATFWNPNVGDPPWAGSRRLVIARYTSQSKPWGNIYDQSWLKPLPWDDWWMWQYSADGNGRGAEFGVKSADIDINRYNGTLEQFHKEIGWNQGDSTESKMCHFVRLVKELCEKYLKEHCE